MIFLQVSKMNLIKLCNIYNRHISLFNPTMVKDNICKLKSGKAPGSDSLYAEHFIFANDRLHVLLSLIFNSMLRHGYVPDALMNTVIIPII